MTSSKAIQASLKEYTGKHPEQRCVYVVRPCLTESSPCLSPCPGPPSRRTGEYHKDVADRGDINSADVHQYGDACPLEKI